MGRKNKLRKFAEVLSFPNVYECYDVQQPCAGGRGHAARGTERPLARASIFTTNNPITLELACGGGEYTVALARQFPERNFIGVDVKGNRLWKGAKHRAGGKPGQRWPSCAPASRSLTTSLPPARWTKSGSPSPTRSRAPARRTAASRPPIFLDKYRLILRPGGLVHLKHDDPDFYRFTLDTVAADPRCRLLYADDDIYAKPLPSPELGIQTLYERHAPRRRQDDQVRPLHHQ
jgi:tRNA (guanine-N7-)-methyltransferase